MKVLNSDRFERLCRTYCGNYDVLLSLLHSAESSIAISQGRIGARQFDEITINMGQIATSDLKTRIAIIVRRGSNVFVRRDILLRNPLDLDFRHSREAKWLNEVDSLMLECIKDVFTAGVFSLSRHNISPSGIMEERDVETL